MPLYTPAFPPTFERALEAHGAGYLRSHKTELTPFGPYDVIEGHEAYGRWLAGAVLDPETGRPLGSQGVPKLSDLFLYAYAFGYDDEGEPDMPKCVLRVGAVTSAYHAQGLRTHDAAASALRGLFGDNRPAFEKLESFINTPPVTSSGYPYRYAKIQSLSRAEPSETEFGGPGQFGASWVFSETLRISGHLVHPAQLP